MAITPGTYDRVIVRFDPNTFGIQHIKIFNGADEQGTIDREASHRGTPYPGYYHPDGSDISLIANQVHLRRQNADPNTTDGIALIYRFNDNNDVDVTRMNLSTHPRYAFFMLMDPIHTEVRNVENINPFAGSSVADPHTHQGCLVGRIKRKEDE